MVEQRLSLRRYWIWGAALLTGGLLFWIALHCDGGDWFISQTHGDIMYTALSRFREFPYFSFVFNGGSYFIQDPQSNLFSPVMPLVMLAGPTVGLRLMEGIWGVLGVLGFVAFMRQSVCLEAAIIGGVASALGMGVLWKIAVGNDMFMWHLGLPAILWTAQRIIKQRTTQSMLSFALVLGLMLLGPTFHSFTYLFLPAVPLFVLLELFFARPTRQELARTVLLFAGGCALALLMISPKLVCWMTFPMGRPVADIGTLPFSTGLRQMFDYWQTKEQVIAVTRQVVSKRNLVRGWGVEESAIALPPIASLLAILGIFVAFRSPARRRRAAFPAILVIVGCTLCCSEPVWTAFRALTGGNFRVASRFLGLTAFGLAVFAAFGADALFARLKRGARPAAVAVFALMVLSAGWWTRAAGRVPEAGRASGDDVHENMIWPRAMYRDERAAVAKIDTFTDVVRYRGRRDILDGIGYTDGFLVVGNDFDEGLWSARQPEPIMVMGKPEHITFEHLRVKVRHMAARSRIFLRLRKPAFGLAVVTDPPDARVRVREQGSFLVIENHSYSPVERVVLRAEFPISVAWVVAAVFGLVGTIAALVWLEVARRRTAGRSASAALTSLDEGLEAR